MTKQNKILWTISTVIVMCTILLSAMSHRRVGTGRDLSVSREVMWSVHVLDVGQGDAIFVELPDGVQILVDGGVDDSVLSRLSEVMLPWDRSIDYIVVTHPHADHINGLIEVLERYDVANVVIDNVVYESVPYEILKDRIVSEGARIIDPDNGGSILRGVVNVEIVYPGIDPALDVGDDVNEKSLVLKIYDRSSSILLTGDAGKVVEDRIGGLVGDIDILKVGHHGSTYGTSRSFLQVIDPEVAIISVGEGNDYYHPHKSTLKRLADFGIDVYRTDIHGTVSVEFFEGGYRLVSS